MPPMPKSSILSFAKKAAAPPPAATVLAKKRAMAKPPAPPAGAPQRPAAPPEEGGEEQELYLHELVEEAAEEAEAGADIELEDAIAGSQSAGPEDVPEWAEDPQKWAEAAQAVDLGGAAEDLYDEPHVVVAYLYRKIGGPVRGMELPAPPEAPQDEEGGGDEKFSKPGAAAKAIAARAQGKGPAPEAGAKPPAARAAPAQGAQPAKPGAPKPAMKPALKPAPKPGAAPGAAAPAAGGGDELQAMVQEAAASPDPVAQEKLGAYDPARDGEPPPGVSDAEKWAQAKAAAEVSWAELQNPWVVVGTLYAKMGGVFA